VCVLDSVGVGALPDAGRYNDEGANTLANIAQAVGGLDLPNLGAMGLGNITAIEGVPPCSAPSASWGRCLEQSAGKDTTTGHWEMMGVFLDRPFPTYPHGFPASVMKAFSVATGYGWLGNCVASGTEIINRYGDEHVATGKPIIYTSADSVFQVAAHEDVIAVDELYRICGVCREAVLTAGDAVGRVIARPFTGPGADGRYLRTHRRRDFALDPPVPMVLDHLAQNGIPTHGIGKIAEIFAGRGVTDSVHTKDNAHGLGCLIAQVRDDADNGFVFGNLVDFDMLWGHRNDAHGYARGLEELDACIPELLQAMGDGDMLIITADHGCDPTTASTDHSREYIPVLVSIKGAEGGVDLGTRKTFADIGRSVLDFYGCGDACESGTSFLSLLPCSRYTYASV